MPHIPPPPPTGHSAGTNETTKAPTPENAPCWHETVRPREICVHIWRGRSAVHGPCDRTPSPPPPHYEGNALVRAPARVVSATFGGKAPLRPYQRAQRRPRRPPARLAEQPASSGAPQPAARTEGTLLSARAWQGTRLHRRALPHAWGAVMRALPGNGPGSCQLLPVRTHRPPQGNRSANGPGIVRHATGHAEPATGGAGLRGQRHAWLAVAAE